MKMSVLTKSQIFAGVFFNKVRCGGVTRSHSFPKTLKRFCERVMDGSPKSVCWTFGGGSTITLKQMNKIQKPPKVETESKSKLEKIHESTSTVEADFGNLVF